MSPRTYLRPFARRRPTIIASLLAAVGAATAASRPTPDAAERGTVSSAPGGTTSELARPEGTIAYDVRGDGPLVLLLPGLGDLRQEYRLLVPRLVAGGYRVATADLRGHGGSSTGWPDYASESVGRDVVALVEHLGGPAGIVGNSFAAGPAVWAATERPDLVRGVALIGPFVRDHPVSPLMRAVMRLAFHGPWKVRAWTAYYGTLFPTAKPDDFEDYRRALRANLAEPGRFAAVQAMLNRSDAAIEARLPRVDVPSIVLMGSKDPDFTDPAGEATWIARAMGAEARMLDGAGHYPQTEMPDATAAHLLAFLEATAGAR